MMLPLQRILITATGCLVLVFAIFPSASAATFFVNKLTDSVDASPGNGTCADSSGLYSLRAAIREANALAGSDIITLPSGTYQLTLAGSTSDITINGTDPRTTFVHAGSNTCDGIDRVFEMLAGGTLTLSGTARFGKDGSGIGGGGFRVVLGGTLNLTNSVVTQNSTTTNGGAFHVNGGTANVSGSALSATSANGLGGVIIVNNTGTLRLTNTTISGNTAATSNGWALRNTSGTTTTITNCTITANSGVTGGGINSAGTMNIRNPIIAGNTATTDADATGTFTSGGSNLIGVQGSSTGWVGSDLLNNTNARLAPLGDYGGKSPSHAFLSGSAALNVGQNCVNNSSCATFNAPASVSTDQRGFARPASTTTDIGAFELPATPTDFNAVLPNGRQNQPYSITIAANTTFGPTFTYTLFGGDTLRAGLSLTTAFAPQATQQISGTPTVNGTFDFRIQTVDGANTQVTRYQLNVLVPTAAPVSLSGRALDPSGNGLGKATITVTLMDGSIFSSLTSPFGYYRFDGLTAGQTVVVQVLSKRLAFSPQLITLADGVTGLDFPAPP